MTKNPICKQETPPPPALPAAPPQTSHPQRFSAFVAKCTLQDGIELDNDWFADIEGDESDTDTSDNDSDSGDSDE